MSQDLPWRQQAREVTLLERGELGLQLGSARGTRGAMLYGSVASTEPLEGVCVCLGEGLG